jgi:transcriptional regulator with XRE-family HTH domain
LFLSTTKLKTLRNEKGWSQEVVAKVSGLSVRTIQRIEADGKSSPESTLAIASVFDLSPKELLATSNDIEVNWTRKMIIKNFIALIMMSGAIGGLMWIWADIYFFLNVPSALYIIFFVYAASIISFGSDGTLESIYSLKYLFTDEIMGGAQAQYLAQVFHSQIRFCYGGAFIGLIVASISTHANIDTLENVIIHRAYAVNLIVVFYAAVISEVILRPLSIKFKTCDMKQ